MDNLKKNSNFKFIDVISRYWNEKTILLKIDKFNPLTDKAVSW